MNNLELEPSDLPFVARIIGRSYEIVRKVSLSEKSELKTVLHLKIRQVLELKALKNKEFEMEAKEIMSSPLMGID